MRIRPLCLFHLYKCQVVYAGVDSIRNRLLVFAADAVKVKFNLNTSCRRVGIKPTLSLLGLDELLAS